MREDNLLAVQPRAFVVTTDSKHQFEVYLNLASRMKLTGINDACRKFLKSHGISPNDVAKTLNRQIAYDASKSSISMAAAGLLPANDRDSQMSVESFFKTFGIDAAAALHAGKTRNDVYYSEKGLAPETIIHEALHTLTGIKSDVELARKLGMTVDEIWEMNTKGTKVISHKLAANGCGGTTP